MNDSTENESQDELLERHRKTDAMALAELIYDIYQDKKANEKDDGAAA